ncbi:MAG TPA: amidohydrolase family protein [Alphaproteobacteria bacterium]|nr:amidohydrolase family protein [Alphaproteobacteria bacterium]
MSVSRPVEDVLEPDLPIVDPHHHLWDRREALGAPSGDPQTWHGFTRVVQMSPRYLLEELLEDAGSGHNVVATVFVECRSMWRADGPPELRPVGETEFVNGVAAMCASGTYGRTRACAGIVGHADLRLPPDTVDAVLKAHIAAGGGRFRGIRHSGAHHADPAVLGPLHGRVPAGMYATPEFRAGFARLAPNGLSFDAWVLEPQLPEVVDLARAFPETTIVLDHVGTPLGIASHAGRRDERFEAWRRSVRALADCPNVHVKLGGLAMAYCGFPSFLSEPAASSLQLAREWRPYVDECIDAFGPSRCMFESNFPVDLGSCSYATLWNAFKRIAADRSAADRRELFSGTAARVYRLELP